MHFFNTLYTQSQKMMPFVVFEFWYFGFLMYYTHSPWFAAAVVYIIEIAVLTWPVHAVMAETMGKTVLLQLTQVHGLALLSGIAVAIAFLYATDFPRVLDVRVFYDDPQRSTVLGGKLRVTGPVNSDRGLPWAGKLYLWSLLGLVLPFAMLTATVALFAGLYVDAGALNMSQSVIIGAVLAAFAVLFIGAYCLGAITRRNDMPDSYPGSGLINAKYFLLFVLLAHTPVYNDFLPQLGPWGRYFVMVAVALILYIVLAFVGRYDRLLGTESAERVFATIALIFVIHVSVYAGSPIIMVTGNNTLAGALAYIGIASAAWVIVLTYVGAVRRRQVTLDQSQKRTEQYMARTATTTRTLLPPQ